MSIKYTGPAKRIRLAPRWTLMEKIERIVFLLGLIVIALDVFVWRP